MKKFIVVVCVIVALFFFGYQAYYRLGMYVDLDPETPVTTFMKTDESTIYMEKDGRYVPFEIRGVDMGAGIPGQWATDFAIDKKIYLRWFQEIQDMGANTIRVYTILHQDFYDAFYEYNTQREADGLEPLYLIHGVWINDYVLFSHRSAFDEDFLDVFLEDCHTVIDIIHGERSLSLGYQNRGSGNYWHDISDWVIGYILGVEWEDYTVIYTDMTDTDKAGFTGKYLYTTEDASPFESMLAQVGDKVIEYESNRYKRQCLVAFANWPTTDPFVYPETVVLVRQKLACIDVEHIKSTDAFISGMFASYHAYSYYPDYLEILRDTQQYTEEDLYSRLGAPIVENIRYRCSLLKGPHIEDYLSAENQFDSSGHYNTYLAYLKALTSYHTIPVVISEYGVTTGRGMAQIDKNTNRNQGHMSEQEQGQALVDCFKDIRAAGCAGGCAFTWQDEWFKRTWNTMHAVDLENTAYWSDYQTNEQFFGLLTFDPGEEKSVCYVDGDVSEWTDDDRVISYGDTDLSVKYDEKFIYFLVHKEGFNQSGDTLFIPIDTNPKVGSTYCENYDIPFERAADFVIAIHGKSDSRVMVQERYECLNAIYGKSYYGRVPYYDPPEINSEKFTEIYMALTLEDYIPDRRHVVGEPTGEKYETGQLRYGNANPDAPDFDSLADFIFSGDYVEIRIPWQLLNFSNPSEMMIHDDYYECYGIENYHIDEMYVGVCDRENTEYRIPMNAVPLKGWGKDVTYHERLKRSYYILQAYWRNLDSKEQPD